jgi:UDP-3-O-[3-hydroxymyristoyl] glucosamine N-acyltransferase
LFSLQHLADFLQGELVLKDTKTESISSISSIENATKNQLAYISKKKLLPSLKTTTAGVVILNKDFVADCPVNAIIVDNPALTFAKVSHKFKTKTVLPKAIHSSCIIAKSANISPDVNIGAFCCIGENVTIASGVTIQSHTSIADNVHIDKGCYFHPNITIAEGVKIGSNTILHSGCVIGSDGFGNEMDSNQKWHKIAQVGSVQIGNNVEIGANTTIDRGAINDTIISDGVRIDNLVHIAHNVQIGQNCAIAACVAIAGSTILGNSVLIGGNAAIADHLNITDNVIITGLTAIDKDITRSDTYTGFMPAVPHSQWLRLSIIWRRKVAKITRFFQKQFQKD